MSDPDDRDPPSPPPPRDPPPPPRPRGDRWRPIAVRGLARAIQAAHESRTVARALGIAVAGAAWTIDRLKPKKPKPPPR